ncbi:hypothetical protein [Herbiconiux sp. VKM Ac-2851]|uniref:hypothetical protein n=1 Tax=Herbiconiux sp. VKM Ac-2851 TaxID=2739025 RepID=UPI001564B0B5|nr:hypothetical protein [Herbiconiux sp. VKM Ac-2851]NQX36273.1 hypothetical protein [Herbiconiux sp. VKM Ac-2851]
MKEKSLAEIIADVRRATLAPVVRFSTTVPENYLVMFGGRHRPGADLFSRPDGRSTIIAHEKYRAAVTTAIRDGDLRAYLAEDIEVASDELRRAGVAEGDLAAAAVGSVSLAADPEPPTSPTPWGAYARWIVVGTIAGALTQLAIYLFTR